MHIICVWYVYYLLWYAYHPCLIYVPSTTCPGMHIRHRWLSIIHISSVYNMHTRAGSTRISETDDMHTINVYAYHPCPICILPALVRISYTDDMHTTAVSTHIIHGQYMYTFIVRISSVSDMCTRAGSTHIGHGRYAYTIYCTHIIHVRYAYQSR